MPPRFYEQHPTRMAEHTMTIRFRVPKEFQEQVALFTWARLHEQVEPKLALLYAVPNGELRSKATAAKLQKMGVKAGVPDICLPAPVRHVHDHKTSWEQWYGCYLEMKRATYTGALALEQAWWHARLSEQRYDVYVARGWVDAARHLCWYLGRQDLRKALVSSPGKPSIPQNIES